MNYDANFLESVAAFEKCREALGKLVGSTDPSLDRIARRNAVDVDLLTQFVKHHFGSPIGLSRVKIENLRRQLEAKSGVTPKRGRLFRDDDTPAPDLNAPKSGPYAPKVRFVREDKPREFESGGGDTFVPVPPARETEAPVTALPGFEVLHRKVAKSNQFVFLNGSNGELTLTRKMQDWLNEHGKPVAAGMRLTILANRQEKKVALLLGDGVSRLSSPGPQSPSLRTRLKPLAELFPEGARLKPIEHDGREVILVADEEGGEG